MREICGDEQTLLEKLDASPRDRDLLLALLKIYDAQNRQDEVINKIELFLPEETDGNTRAHLRLFQGCAAEKMHRYSLACDYYEKGMKEECSAPITRYFLRNNLGFCLNERGDYFGGERWCREAIGIDDEIPNGWKNLGIALKGQDRWLAAAWAFIGALKNLPIYVPASRELAGLMTDHPELRERDPGLVRAITEISRTRRRRAAGEQAEGAVMEEKNQSEETPEYPSAEMLAAAFVQKFRQDETATTLGERRRDRRPQVWVRARILAERDDGVMEEMKVNVMEDTERDAALRFAEAVFRGEPRLRIFEPDRGVRKIRLGEDTDANGLYIYER